MPCWYYEKKEIKNSPSYKDGIDSSTENRYRREGSRFIVEAGTKLKLRYDTCATGVVYFHRFYMFHSFKDFPRYVTASCCLFLAGKVEETPKKCKDIIKISQTILNGKQFAQFGNDPREEVMTLERILLQTIKFDLQTEHPYAFLLKYAKMIKADKEKVQKLVQMAWTFINDSLCTTLSLQWEPEIIAVSLMYLGTRLNKLDVTDWDGKVLGTKQRWWESLVADLTVELMEDVCHQVLDLYSPSNQPQAEPRDSPPPPPPALNPSRTPNSQSGDRKRSLQSTPSDQVTPGSQSLKSMKMDHGGQAKRSTPQKSDKGRESSMLRGASQASIAEQAQQSHTPQQLSQSGSVPGQDVYGANPVNPQTPQTSYTPQGSTDFTQYNPYISSGQYQASFMSGEGAQSIQNIMGSHQQAGAYSQASSQQPQYPNYNQPPPPVVPGAPPPPAGQYSAIQGSAQYPPGYNPSQYPSSAVAPGPVGGNRPGFSQPSAQSQQQYQGSSYQQYNQGQFSSYQQPAGQGGYDTQGQYGGGVATGAGQYSGGQQTGGQRQRAGQNQRNPRPSNNLATVRITGR
ncbi:cyclin-K-like isoform X1 [Mya arenaria]|uniref:cyclin-K-like isoform X1 n=1 Tax=Mya arenaria TaxID=6604 RepID=UPI0022E91E84|nr:cyclin-K-like isoform X1 [Mya arenaria]